MITKFIEASHGGGGNWGKFMIARFDPQEWAITSALPEAPNHRLLAGRGWSPRHLLFLDLQTGEGTMLSPGGIVSADLNKHKVWVCPLAEPFLEWLYQQDLTDITTLPAYVELPDAPFAVFGYRRGQESPDDLPKILRMTRAKLGLTQAELGARIGVSFATVNRWEAGSHKPQRANLGRILELAGN